MGKAAKEKLGRGLDAVFLDNNTSDGTSVMLRVSEIEPNRSQPRRHFDENSLAELADSIQQHGVLQPLVVRPLATGGYQIIAGERRWRACRMANVSEVPAIVREMTDQEVMEIALIENLQREDLNAIEEAAGYQSLMDLYGLTQEQVASRVGKSRSAVTNSLRLLNLPGPVADMVREGLLSAGHARALLSIPKQDVMIETARKAASGNASVREIERISKKLRELEKDSVSLDISVPVPVPPEETGMDKEPYFRELEISLTEALGRRVSVRYSQGKGTLEIEFYSKEDLQGLTQEVFGHLG